MVLNVFFSIDSLYMYKGYVSNYKLENYRRLNIHVYFTSRLESMIILKMVSLLFHFIFKAIHVGVTCRASGILR